MTLQPTEKHKLTRSDYYAFLTKPRPTWSLSYIELSKLIKEKQNSTSATVDDDLFPECSEDALPEALGGDAYLELLAQIKERRLQFLNDLNTFLLDTFKANVSAAEFKNTVIHHCGQHQRTVAEYQKILAENSTVFLFQPKFEDDNFIVKPFCIFKHKGNIFLIDRFSTNKLHRYQAARYVFDNHVLNHFFKIHIDQFAHIYKDVEGNNAITECLPRTAKEKKFTDINDSKFSDVNLFLKKQRCLDSLYLLGLPKREESDENWDSFNFDIYSISDAISEMINKTPADIDSETQLIESVNYFLANQKSLCGVNNDAYKMFFRLHINNMSFSFKYYKFDLVIKKLAEYGNVKKLDEFLQWINNMGPFERPHVIDESEKEFFIFEQALVKYAEYKKIKNVVYYDLESICLAQPALYQQAPFQHEIVQVSVIKCKNGTETEEINEIFDEESTVEAWLEKLINSIYLKGDDVCYVVYNKSFENTALAQIANLFPRLSEKVADIIRKTVDLSDWFAYNNDPYIIARRLGGYHSIKKVTQLIGPDIMAKAKLHNYADLDFCKDGLDAQIILNHRFSHPHTCQAEKDLWEESKQSLKLYCANDVRAMIAVDLFIDEILQTQHTVYPLEEFLDKKKNLKNI